VVAIDNYLIDGKWPTVLKTYKSSVNLNACALEKIVAFPDRLLANDRDWLMGTSSWPWAVAVDNGIPRGLLMRVVPGIYEFNFMTVTQGRRTMLSTVEFLLNSDSYIRAAGISISGKDRLDFLGGLANTVSRLHALGVVVGDLSPKNLLFNSNSYSECFLIDCDAIALNGESALEQIDTPDWEILPHERKGTKASDSYKFGLLAIRLFARDQSSHDISAISALSPELGRLAALSQDSDPLKRPSPGSWVSAIQSATWTASQATSAQGMTTQTSPPQPSPVHQHYRTSSNQQYQPVGTQPRSARPAPRRRSGARAAGLSVLALLVLALVIVGIEASRHHTASLSASSGATSDGSASLIPSSPPAPPSSSPPAPSPEPTRVGVITIGDNVSSDPEATGVAHMFDTYFSGINSKNYQQALSVFDPSGIVDPNDSSQAQSFIDGVKTSNDSHETLVNVDPPDGSTAQSAEVQFTSHQQAGYGPKDSPDATCTNWDITYDLTQDSSGSYLINSVSGASDSSC
jgi:serine/threonine protein kinase